MPHCPQLNQKKKKIIIAFIILSANTKINQEIQENEMLFDI